MLRLAFNNRESRKRMVFLNSLIGIVCLVIPILLQFVSRKYFLEYLDVEYLGIFGIFTSLLQTLSLADFGLQSAIVYCLYKPLREKDYNLISSLMNVMRVIYKWIGVFFLVSPLILLPYLGKILKGVDVNEEITVCFFIEACGSAFTYFLAYKRALLFADQKDFVSKITDLICNLGFVIIQIISLILCKSFLLYCIFNTVRILFSNVIVNYWCSRLYPYLRKEVFSKESFKVVWSYAKNVIFIKLAGYVYGATDNLVISTVIGASMVGYLGNYTLLTSRLSSVVNGMLDPVKASIGNLLIDGDIKKNKLVFDTYTFVRLVIVSVIIVPLFVVVDDFVIWWIGNEYVLSHFIKSLLIADLFINLYYSSCCDFIAAAGLFKFDRSIGITGAFMNISISIVLAHLIGLEGILIGTVLSQVFFWIARSALTFRYCLKANNKTYLCYWMKSIQYLFVIMGLLYVSSFCYSSLPIANIFLKIIVGSVGCLLLVVSVYLLLYSRSVEFLYLKNNYFKTYVYR